LDTKITFKQLEILHAVVVAGSITRAAQITGLSQPSMSQHLAKLEGHLGSQLLYRNRSSSIELTRAGEYWFKCASQLLTQYNDALSHHRALFSTDSVSIRLGTTPTLRGRFAAAVARIALQEDPNAQFKQYWGLNSAAVVERLRLHQINCAVINATSIEEDCSSYAVTPMFRDTIAWVVPVEIPKEALIDVVAGDPRPIAHYPALARHVSLSEPASMQPASDGWYRHHMPLSSASFNVMSYVSAIELVSEGLATAHCPLSLLPNLSSTIADRLRLYRIDWISRQVVLAVQKHLLTLSSYARIHEQMQTFLRTEYIAEMSQHNVQSFSELTAGLIQNSIGSHNFPRARAPVSYTSRALEDLG